MASSSTSFLVAAPIGLLVTEKLTRHNFSLWKAQIMPAIRDGQLEGFLNGKAVEPPKEIEELIDAKKISTPNEAYAKWVAANQQVLGYLLLTVSKEILTQIADKKMVIEA